VAGPAAGRTAQGCGNGGGTGGTRHQRDSDDLAAVISLHRAFPDIDVIVADMFAEQDKVVTRVIARSRTSRPPRGGQP